LDNAQTAVFTSA